MQQIQTAQASQVSIPEWARRSHRALPALRAPRLGSRTIDRRGRPQKDHPVFQHLGRLRLLLVGRPLIATAAFVVAALNGWWLIAVPLTWLVYGSTLTAVHHLTHSGLGFSPRVRHIWLSVLGAVVVESGHALMVTHLAHHRAGENVPDPEGYIENVTWAQMPLAALRFRYRLMAWGWRYTTRRRRVNAEIAFHTAAHVGALALLPVATLPWIYLSLIHLASFAFAVLAGKGPQTNWGREISTPFVRVNTLLGAIIFFSHDRHLEHHAYPTVPLPRLRKLVAETDLALAGCEILDVNLPDIRIFPRAR